MKTLGADILMTWFWVCVMTVATHLILSTLQQWFPLISCPQ